MVDLVQAGKVVAGQVQAERGVSEQVQAEKGVSEQVHWPFDGGVWAEGLQLPARRGRRND